MTGKNTFKRINYKSDQLLSITIKANDYDGSKSNFDYAGPLTETMLLGCVAARVGSGTKRTWDSKNMTTGNDLADRYIRHEYRNGWSL